MLYLLMYLMMFFVSIAIYTLYAFVFQLIVDYDLPTMDALKCGFRASMMNLGGVMMLIILQGFIMLVLSMLCCGIGAYFYLPCAFGSMAVAYRKVFPDPQELTS